MDRVDQAMKNHAVKWKQETSQTQQLKGQFSRSDLWSFFQLLWILQRSFPCTAQGQRGAVQGRHQAEGILDQTKGIGSIMINLYIQTSSDLEQKWKKHAYIHYKWALSPIASGLGAVEGKSSFISLGRVSGSSVAVFTLVTKVIGSI